MNIGVYNRRAGTLDSSGVSVFVQETSKKLAADHRTILYTEAGDIVPHLRSSAVEITQITPSRNEVAETLLERFSPFSYPDIPKLLLFAGAVRDGVISHINENVDILLTHHYLDDLLLSNVVDVPVVYHYHILDRVGIGSRARERLSRSDGRIANSRATARRVRDEFGRRVDGVVHPGVDIERFTPDARPAFEPPDDEFAVLYVGRFVERKGVFDLIEAVAAVDDAHLYLIGRGDTDALRRGAARAGIADQLTIVGEVDHDAVPGYYTACDVCCHPSYYETFGMTNIEAMACSTPVIATSLDSVREYADDGENAVLVPPGDVESITESLERLRTSPTRRAELGAAGRETARDYSWENQAARLAELYGEFLY